MKKILWLTKVLLLSAFIYSCGPVQRLNYFYDQTPGTKSIDSLKDSIVQRIHEGDRISVLFSCPTPDLTAFLNPVSSPADQTYGYMVTNEGKVNLPLIGYIKVSGLTPEEASAEIQKKISYYYKDAYVTVNLYGRVVVVNSRSGGIVPLVNGRLTIFEAVAQQGNQEIFERRNRVWVVREENGKRTFAKVDLTKKEIFDSPYYYLHNNDLIYIGHTNISAIFGVNSPARGMITATSSIIALIIALTRL